MKTHQILFIFLLFISLLSGPGGCALQKPNLPPQHIAGTSVSPKVLIDSYKMAVGDQLMINVWKNPSLSLSEPIRPDGKISVPLVGDVMAAGLTPEELAAVIEKKLSTYVKSPNVTIILTSLQGHAFLSRIRVTGSVTKNISLPYHQGMTVLDAVLEAGSVDLYADSNNTKLHRRTKTGTETYDIRLKNIMLHGDMSTNVTLMPGDIITVPERGF
ncbi:MAG: polysaccharide biosynthesis/export family protein [Gammaproteobacteria bacterium]|nr:polysaccharide biosynthesis/export family protein [Gammaproteobacteria bacterium]